MENLWVYKQKDQLNFRMTGVLFNKPDGFKIFIPLCGTCRYRHMKAGISVTVGLLRRAVCSQEPIFKTRA